MSWADPAVGLAMSWADPAVGLAMSWTREQHPPCPRGCGQLEDECEPSADRLPARIIDPQWSEYDADLDVPMTCRWPGRRPCTEPAEAQGLCDAHLGTL